MPDPLAFEILARSGRTRARLGRVTTPHGDFDTPAFMPVGTKGTIKGILPEQIRAVGTQILLNNTYHLMLRPGADLVAELGGVHAFMGWDAPILTDSGGYQAYSMADANAVDDDGVTFRSVVNGSKIRLTPERAIEIQNQLGPDIIMAFDDCPPSSDPTAHEFVDPRLREAVKRDARSMRGYDHARRLSVANERTVRWLERCVRAHARPDDQALFGIVQGGTDLDARAWCAERVCNVDLPGYAIGGVAVGEAYEQMAPIVRHTAERMPDDRPRYLMGVGYERDLLGAVLAGVDMFDCVLPTRNGRNANAFVSCGQIRLRNARFARDPGPLDPACDCPACDPAAHGWRTPDARPFSRAYIRHLFIAGEMLGPILVSLHNLRHFQRFMADVRATIRTDDWAGLVSRWPRAADGIVDPAAGAVPETPGEAHGRGG